MIQPGQLTAYDAASKEVEKACQTLEAINVARLDVNDRAALADVIAKARNLRAGLYHEAHNAYLKARDL